MRRSRVRLLPPAPIKHRLTLSPSAPSASLDCRITALFALTAMPDDDARELDLPGPDTVYESHLEACRRAGVEPVPREHAEGLIADWNDVLSEHPEPTTH
jgi:hypothetical protein